MSPIVVTTNWKTPLGASSLAVVAVNVTLNGPAFSATGLDTVTTTSTATSLSATVTDAASGAPTV